MYVAKYTLCDAITHCFILHYFTLARSNIMSVARIISCSSLRRLSATTAYVFNPVFGCFERQQTPFPVHQIETPVGLCAGFLWFGHLLISDFDYGFD